MTPHAKSLPLLAAPQRAGLLSRMFSHIARVAADGCWVWGRQLTPDGYGRVSVLGKTYSAHRVMYELLVEPLAPDVVPDHRCHTRACVNPAHAEPVTVTENSKRARRVRPDHCRKGHRFDEANTRLYTRSNGEVIRYCRACRRAQHAVDRAAHPERWRTYNDTYRAKKRVAREAS